MTIRRDPDGTILLDGKCPVEDAERLLEMLQASPAAPVDWTRCEGLHTAVVQVLMAAGATPVGPCGDAWTEAWLALKIPGDR